MKTYRLSELQNELRAKGIPELSERLKKETGYDARARKLRRNPKEAQAVEEGVSELYRKQIADAYLADELDRKKAVAELGEEYAENLDYTRKAIEADIQWGLKSA